MKHKKTIKFTARLGLVLLVAVLVFSNILPQPFPQVPQAQAAALGDGRLIYGTATTTAPQERTWVSGTLNTASALPVATANIQHTKVKPSTTADASLAVVQSSAANIPIYVYRRSGATWTQDWTANTVNPVATQRGFDVDYEDLSGRGIVAYTTNTSSPKYRIWRPSLGTWTAELSITVARTTGAVRWVQMTTRPGTDEIALIYSDANSDLNVLVSTGCTDTTCTWAQEPAALLEGGLGFAIAAADVKAFDADYLADGRLMVVWSINLTPFAKSTVKTAGSGTYTTCFFNTTSCATSTAVYAAAIGNVSVRAEPTGGTNRAVFAGQDTAGNDLEVAAFDGTKWSVVTSDIDASTGAVGAALQLVETAFVVTGTVRQGIVFYVDSTGTGLDWYNWNASGGATTFAAGTDIVVTPALGVGTEKSHYARTRPDTTDELMMMTVDSTTSTYLTKLVWTGAAACVTSCWTVTNTTAASIASPANQAISSPLDFAYERFIPAPSTTLTISVSAGSKLTNVDSGATSAFVHDITCTTDATCAAFKMAAGGGGTATVTSIKITQTGTLTASTDLTNPTIIYDTDANYANGTGGTFGTIASFTAQTATITGSVGIASGSTYYFYVRTDFLNGTARPDGGLTVNYQIAVAADVVVTGITPTCSASCPVSLAGTTTIRPNVTGFSNSTEPALTDGARTTQTISIAGHGFGTTCNGTTAKVEIGTFVVSCTGATFSDTSITIAVDAAVNVYGGTTTNGLLVTIGATADDARSTFYVYPAVTSLSPTAATGAKEGDNVVITGTKFRAAQGTGSVQFTNCGTTSGTIVGWGDTSVTVTIPAGVLDDDDLCDILITRDTDAKTVTSTGYVILPKITSLSVCAACNADSSRTYLAAEIEGVVQLNGNHFGTAQGAGTVQFTGGLGTGTPNATIHGTVEGACGVAGWAAAATSICIEVTPGAILSTAYTGSITVNRNGGGSYAYSTLRVLPRITTNTPVQDVVGNVIQIDGNHFCQAAGVCAATPPTAAEFVQFGTTNALTADFVTTPNCTGASKWSNTQICVKVPVGTPTGSQPTKVTSNTSYVSNTKAFTVPSTVPSTPTVTEAPSRQYKSNDTTTIAVGGTTNETSVYLKADLAASLAINMVLQIEVQPTGTAFTCTGTNAIGVGGCAAYAAGAGTLEGTTGGVSGCSSCTSLSQAKLNFTALAQGSKHWQARARNTTTQEYSAWVSYGGNGDPSGVDFTVDSTGPVITFTPTDTCAGGQTNLTTNGVTISWSLSESADGQVEYSINSDLSASTNYPSSPAGSAVSHSISLSNLSSGTLYYYKVKSTDANSNLSTKPTVSPFCTFTTSSVSQPSKTTSFHITGETASIGASSSITKYFAVVAPELTAYPTTIKSAFVEVTGVVSGGTGVTITANSQAARTYTISAASPTVYRFVYEITSPTGETKVNVNDTAPCSNASTPGTPPNCNKLIVTTSAGMNLYITSAKIIVNYAYTP